jgi:hypothetical protein
MQTFEKPNGSRLAEVSKSANDSTGQKRIARMKK